jgi:hypothetical protein
LIVSIIYKRWFCFGDKEVDLFNFIDKTPIENLHLSFSKYVLGIRKKASNLAVRLELGRLPVENFIKYQTLLYFARLYTTKLNPLLKESLLLCQNVNPVYLLEMVLMGLKYMKVFLILISY